MFEYLYRATPAITNNRNKAIGSRKINDTGALFFPLFYLIEDEYTPHNYKNDATYYDVRAKMLRININMCSFLLINCSQMHFVDIIFMPFLILKIIIHRNVLI